MKNINYQRSLKGTGRTWAQFPELEDIEAAWDTVGGQGSYEAREMGPYCAVIGCNYHDALVLTTMFHRYFAVLTCCYYDRERQILSMFCGHSGRDNVHLLRDKLKAVADVLNLCVYEEGAVS